MLFWPQIRIQRLEIHRNTMVKRFLTFFLCGCVSELFLPRNEIIYIYFNIIFWLILKWIKSSNIELIKMLFNPPLLQPNFNLLFRVRMIVRIWECISLKSLLNLNFCIHFPPKCGKKFSFIYLMQFSGVSIYKHFLKNSNFNQIQISIASLY